MVDLVIGFLTGTLGIVSWEEGRRAALRMLQLRLSIPNCCDMCSSVTDSYGCWDCQNTGHPHAGLCSWDRR